MTGPGERVSAFVQRRRSLREEFERILCVQAEADDLFEEMRRRRDGESPRQLDLSFLRAAVEEVDRRV